MKNQTPNTPAVKTTPATSTPDLKPLRTKHLASRFNLKATALRRILRSMPAYADGVHTNYSWAENDPAIKAIETRIGELSKEKVARAAAAKLALDKRAQETAAAKKADAAA